MTGKRDHQITSESYFPLTKGQLKQKMFFSHTAGRPRLSAHSLGESRSCDPIYVLQNSICPDLPLPPTLHIFLCMVKVSDRLLFFFFHSLMFVLSWLILAQDIVVCSFWCCFVFYLQYRPLSTNFTWKLLYYQTNCAKSFPTTSSHTLQTTNKILCSYV